MQNTQARKAEIERSTRLIARSGMQQNRCLILDAGDLHRVARYITGEVGIQLPESKRQLVESRLRKRLKALGFLDFKSYLDFVLDSEGGAAEKNELIDVLTTNKTSFYREPSHFDFMVKHAIPDMIKRMHGNDRKEFNVWSAGCSSGEEPYTLSIVLNELREALPFLDFNILATDISHQCLKHGSTGIYTEKDTASIPLELRKKYLMRSRHKDDDSVLMGKQLRQYIEFRSLNLMAPAFMIPKKMELIFCRNVMIYFDHETRAALVKRFENQLVDGGYLFIGHSESLNAMSNKLRPVAPMVYQKQ